MSCNCAPGYTALPFILSWMQRLVSQDFTYSRNLQSLLTWFTHWPSLATMHNLCTHRRHLDAKLSIPIPHLLPTNPLHLFLPATLARLSYHRRRQDGGHSCQRHPCMLLHCSSVKWGRPWSDLRFLVSPRKQYPKHAAMIDTSKCSQASKNSSYSFPVLLSLKEKPLYMHRGLLLLILHKTSRYVIQFQTAAMGIIVLLRLVT